jgi:hypothetical protein
MSILSLIAVAALFAVPFMALVAGAITWNTKVGKITAISSGLLLVLFLMLAAFGAMAASTLPAVISLP